MKVDGKGLNLNKLDSAKSSKVDQNLNAYGKNKASASQDGASSSSEVNLSSKAQMMSRAKSIASQDTDVNSEKVERLQKLIDAGKYKMDASLVADRLVDEHLIMKES